LILIKIIHDLKSKEINLKPYFSILLIILSSFFPSSSWAKLTVVTTFTIIQDLAKNVAGDKANILSITKPGAEIHNYQPTPRDIIKAQKADLILWNGLNLELWFNRFFDNLHNVPSVVVTQGIKPMSIYQGPYQGKPNPHAWMSPTNALIYVENIRKTLVKYDPENTDYYNRNAVSYSNKIQRINKNIIQELSQIPISQRWLVTSEGAFSYLARDYDLKEAFLWPINADQQGTPQQVRQLIDTIRENDITVIFSESTISNKPAKQVAIETNCRYGGVLYVDSLSKKSGPVPTYIDLLNVTTSTIIKGLKHEDE